MAMIALGYVALPETIEGKVQQVDGLYIFSYCSPSKEVEQLGTIKVGLVSTNKANDCLPSLVKRAKKQYPNAMALIVSDDFQSAGVYVFK